MSGNTVFINTNFLTPKEMMDKARELFAIAKLAEKQDKFVRVWCDKGEKTGFPYAQAYVDKMSKADRWTWLKGRKAEREQRDAKQSTTAASGDDSGQLALPID